MPKIWNFDSFKFMNFALIFKIPPPIYSLPPIIHEHATISITLTRSNVQPHRYFHTKNI